MENKNKCEGGNVMDKEQIWLTSVPSHILYDEGLTSFEKLLFISILSLSKSAHGYCWATNSYLAHEDRWNCSKSTISRSISRLEEKGYLVIQYAYYEGTKQIKERQMFPVLRPLCKNEHTPPMQKCVDPLCKNVKGIIIKNNKKKKKKKKSKSHSRRCRDSDFSKQKSPKPKRIKRKRLTPLQLEKRAELHKYKKLANKLEFLIKTKAKRTIPKNTNIDKWAISIKKINTQKEIPYEEIKETLNWYGTVIHTAHYQNKESFNKHTPQCFSGESFYEKYEKICNMKEAQNLKQKTNRPSQGYYNDESMAKFEKRTKTKKFTGNE